jgi:hypothetical protein
LKVVHDWMLERKKRVTLIGLHVFIDIHHANGLVSETQINQTSSPSSSHLLFHVESSLPQAFDNKLLTLSASVNIFDVVCNVLAFVVSKGSSD